MGHAPIGRVGLGGAVGGVHGAPIRIRHMIFGRPVEHGVAAEIGGIGLIEGHGARMQEAEMRGVDVAL